MGCGVKLITGKDREAYEELVAYSAHNAGQLLQMKRQLAAAEDYVKVLCKLVEREKQRADNAVDELLAIRGIPPVSPSADQPHDEPMWDEDPKQVASLQARIQAGELADVLEESTR